MSSSSSCLLARAYHRKGSLHRLCRERVLLRIINILWLSGLVYPPVHSFQCLTQSLQAIAQLETEYLRETAHMLLSKASWRLMFRQVLVAFRSGNAELISNTCIAEGEIVAVLGETATIWSQDEFREFELVAVKQNAIESDLQKFEFYVSGSNPENQCHLHVVPSEDAELALSMKITSSLRHSLQSRSE